MNSAFWLSGFADEISPEPEAQIEGLKQAGVGHIEVRRIGTESVLTLPEAEAIAFRSALRAAGIGVSAIGSPVGKVPADANPGDELERLRIAVERALFFESRYIRMFSFHPGALSGDAYREAVLRQLEPMVAHAQKQGVVLLHENEKGIYGDTPERCIDLMRSLGGPAFQAIWDPANFVQCGVTDFTEAWRDLQPYVKYFHIKDALRETRGVVPAGQGDGALKPVIASAAKAGFRGFLSLEPHLREDRFGEDGRARFLTATQALRTLLDELGLRPESGRP